MFGYYGISSGIFTWKKPLIYAALRLQKRDIDTLFSSVFKQQNIPFFKFPPYRSEQTVCTPTVAKQYHSSGAAP